MDLMKGKLKISVIFVAVIFMFVLLTGCSKKPEVSPEETVKIFLDIAIKNKTDDYKKIGITDEEMKKVKKDIEEEYEKAFKQNEAILGPENSDNIIKAIRNGLTKVKYEVNHIEEGNKNVKVEVAVNGMDLNAILEKSESTITEDVIVNLSTQSATEEEFTNKITKMLVDDIVNNLEDPILDSETKYFNVELSVKDGIWEINNIDEFTDFIDKNIILQ